MSRQERRWQAAIEQGDIGVWDLNPAVESVHYSPHWKERFGFPAVNDADSTSFWRCRVHPDDLEPMMQALRAHFDGYCATYEMSFRLRSNGSGYRTVLSRGRAVQRDHRGNATRMVGTMLDLTSRPISPAPQCLADLAVPALTERGTVPFHALLGVCHPAANRQLVTAGCAAARGQVLAAERDGLLAQVEDLLDEAIGRAPTRP